MNKDKFIYFILLFLLLVSCKPKKAEINQNISSDKKNNSIEIDSSDIEIFNKFIKYSYKNELNKKTIQEIEIEIAKYFLGTPYIAHTLEKRGKEHLVVNLREFDCTTFVENVVALTNCVKKNKTTFEDFAKTLTKFRYRNGQIDKYPSRLHYFTDWLLDNEKKGLISIVSNLFAVDNFDPTVDFMSTHPQYYKQLENIDFIKQIAKKEKEISNAELKYIPQEKIFQNEKHIKNGDIIAITTPVKGLDIAHVAMAYFVDGRLHILHASSKQKKVVVSEKNLEDYLKGIKSKDGIIVARLKI